MFRPRNDPSLVRAKAHYHWAIERMRGLDSGELALFVRLSIWERWVVDRKASYAYELAWVFERDRGTIGNVLEGLENQNLIEPVNPGQSCGVRRFYKPTQEEMAYWMPVVEEESEFTAWSRELHERTCPCARLDADQLSPAYKLRLNTTPVG